MGHAKVEKKGPGVAGLMDIVRQLGINPEVRVGVFQGSGTKRGGISNVEVAIINEFGSPKMHNPSRPFMRTAADVFRRQWMELMERVLRQALHHKITIHDALEVVGQRAAADVRRVLLTSMWEPNAPSTIKRKGSSHPLVESMQLARSITHRTDVNGGKK